MENRLPKYTVWRWLAGFSILLLFALWIRIQGIEHLPVGQFTETDGYFYYWQASLISEHGYLPARDMNRWLPVGRDLGQTLNLYGYVLSYAHKMVAFVFPSVTLYHIALYMPSVCFCIGLGALGLFLYHTYGLFFSFTVGVLLATLPGSIERSTAGFGDRDAWCLMIGTLAVVTYLMSLRPKHPHHRILWTLTSGITVFIGGISWEGFGVFLSVILVVEFWRFLTHPLIIEGKGADEAEEGLGYYFLWVLTFVPILYLVSPAYRNGYGFAKHLTAFVLVPPLVLLGIRALRYVLLTKCLWPPDKRDKQRWRITKLLFSGKRRAHTRTFSLTLTIGSIAIAIAYVFIQLDTFGNTTVPLSQNTVMQAMTELRAPHYGYWVARYGTLFIVGSLGIIMIPLYLSKKQGILLSIPLALFTLTTFFRQPLDRLCGETFGNTLFGIALVLCVIALIVVAWRHETKTLNELVSIAFTVWFLVWVALSRDAKRYDFFIGTGLAFGAATLIHWLAQMSSEKLWNSIYVTEKFREDFKPIVLKTSVAIMLLLILMCFPMNSAHTYRVIYTAKQMRKATPGYTRLNGTFRWMKIFLAKKSTVKAIPIVAAHWAHGSQLNVIAGVRTITDQDTYLQHWIHLYHQHVHQAKNEQEALEYLKTHGATHILLTKKDPQQSFLRGQLSKAFVPIYPKVKFAEAEVKLWKIDYPLDIKTDPKYLETGFPEIDTHL